MEKDNGICFRSRVLATRRQPYQLGCHEHDDPVLENPAVLLQRGLQTVIMMLQARDNLAVLRHHRRFADYDLQQVSRRWAPLAVAHESDCPVGILGAGILAPHAGEMAGTFALMIGRKLPLSALAGLVLPYPTLAEAAKRAGGCV